MATYVSSFWGPLQPSPLRPTVAFPSPLKGEGIVWENGDYGKRFKPLVLVGWGDAGEHEARPYLRLDVFICGS
ncbi:MAG: hypothetical protein IIC79_05680 [Chloroflexi bacterium]|nr:hypothetical protein [Chloroflexota bacterium]